MSDPFIGEIRIFPLNFTVRGWALCNGQLLPISQNTALFSILGVTYGGDGRTTFALPNLQGRAPLHAGAGPGLTGREIGESAGEAEVTLLVSEMPSHRHSEKAETTPASHSTPSGLRSLASANSAGVRIQTYGAAEDLAPMGGSVGGDQPHNNRQPYLGLNFQIALQGIFPPRGV
jgi:microcystin-dependent protein